MSRRRWPGGVIPYLDVVPWDSYAAALGPGSKAAVLGAQKALKDLLAATAAFLHLTPIQIRPWAPGDTDYVRLTDQQKPTPDGKGGLAWHRQSADVGNLSGGLGSVNACWWPGINDPWAIAHELTHAAGFVHEVRRPEAPAYVIPPCADPKGEWTVLVNPAYQSWGPYDCRAFLHGGPLTWVKGKPCLPMPPCVSIPPPTPTSGPPGRFVPGRCDVTLAAWHVSDADYVAFFELFGPRIAAVALPDGLIRLLARGPEGRLYAHERNETGMLSFWHPTPQTVATPPAAAPYANWLQKPGAIAVGIGFDKGDVRYWLYSGEANPKHVKSASLGSPGAAAPKNMPAPPDEPSCLFVDPSTKIFGPVGTPACVVAAGSSDVHVAVRGWEGDVFHCWESPAGWKPPGRDPNSITSWTRLGAANWQGGPATSSPVLVSSGHPQRQVDCFVRGPGALLLHRWWRPGPDPSSPGGQWRPAVIMPGGILETWAQVGGLALAGAPAVVVRPGGRVDCFAVGAEPGSDAGPTQLFHRWLPPGPHPDDKSGSYDVYPGLWQSGAWELVAKNVIGPPAVVSRGHRVDLFWMDRSAMVFHRWHDLLVNSVSQSAEYAWFPLGPPENHGGKVTGTPTAVWSTTAVLYLFAPFPDGRMWWKRWSKGKWWPGPLSWRDDRWDFASAAKKLGYNPADFEIW
ncbi:MAG: hypothetical protein HY744_19095 [Deltaproteobacteria bacterium]|nr:hypothetical protein [Deltaproteobacteria bacterium]